jgi:hypothetical protein
MAMLVMAACLGLIKQHRVLKERYDECVRESGLSSSEEPTSRTDLSLRTKPHLAVPHFEKDINQVFWVFFPPKLVGQMRRGHDKCHLAIFWFPLSLSVKKGSRKNGIVRAMVIGSLRKDRMQNHRRHRISK